MTPEQQAREMLERMQCAHISGPYDDVSKPAEMSSGELAELANLIAYRAKPLAKLVTAERGQMLGDWTVRVKNEAAHGIARTINHTTAVVP